MTASTDTTADRERAPTLEPIDWEVVASERDAHRARVTARSLVTAACFLGLLAAWAFDHVARASHEPFLTLATGVAFLGEDGVLTASPSHVDWLFGLTLLVGVRYALVPLWENPRLTRYYWRRIARNRLGVYSLYFLAGVFLVGLIGPLVLGDPEPQWDLGHTPPVGFGGTFAHPLGTTRNGEGILEIVVAGARVSMQVGLIATTISIGLATVVGTTAAFVGGRVDDLLMRGVDLLMTFPTLFFILFLVYIYGGNLFVLVLILAFTTWGGQARLIRSEALQRREEAYIDAARAAGGGPWYVIRRHVVPNVSNTVVTGATLLIPIVILFEAVVAFLGFGDPSVWSWGRIIADGRESLASAWWVSTIPGLVLFLTVLAFNFLGDALRDALDPRHEVNRGR
ncbi:ABC transporter permease [Natronobiforma cellulositropha]|uniref:ABC transporter permease n=1 Tax=Natronobiforma cellulositropha TaxID=1679076 RepID=UPI0021D595DA|nr:ABC transporter permease [Natronobiforma cellulositropha]